MMGWSLLALLLVVSAALCAVGFYHYVYFLSIGYGFSVAGIGVTLGALCLSGRFSAGVQQWLLLMLLVVYGCRLSGFLLVREHKNAAYRKTLKEASGDESKMPLFVKFAIWACVSVLYVAQTCPVFYRLYNANGATIGGWVGIVLCCLALVLESVADKQKTDQKKLYPDRVATEGLYKIVRCPNYLGEILFWTGLFVSGWDILQGPGQWLLAASAYGCIVFVMFNGAQRLESRQMRRYGNDKTYCDYANHTPILLPFVPLYHLNRQQVPAQSQERTR